jgi:hypothetical protein
LLRRTEDEISETREYETGPIVTLEMNAEIIKRAPIPHARVPRGIACVDLYEVTGAIGISESSTSLRLLGEYLARLTDTMTPRRLIPYVIIDILKAWSTGKPACSKKYVA